MGILTILTIFYALFAMGMATDAVAETPASPSAPELSQELDATLTGALAISEDAAEADSTEEKQKEDVTVLGGGDEAAEADTPVALGSDVEVTEDVAENDTPVPADQEVMEDAAEDDTPADSKAPIVKRVVGGYEAGMNSWPWQVSVQYWSGSRYYHTCGGILIKQNWVLTAAHCVDARRSYRVVAGEHDLNRVNCREQFLNVGNIYKHPDWRRNVGTVNDIALLQLSTYATLNSYVNLAILPPANQVLNSGTCYITGWGRTFTRGSTSNVLRCAYLPIVSHSTCRSRYWWGSTVKKTMICAGGNGRQAGCFGDSGGPLNCYRNGRWEVHGIASFVSSRGCDTVRKPTVFTRVSAFTCWINNVTR